MLIIQTLTNKYFNYKENIKDRTSLIAGPAPDSKPSLSMDLEKAMIVPTSFYDKDYTGRESQIFV